MKDQHEKIKTYRDLNQVEIDLINQVKELEARVNGLIDRMNVDYHEGKLKADGSPILKSFIGGEPFDGRCISIAQTNLETGFMYLVKSIAKPERLTK